VSEKEEKQPGDPFSQMVQFYDDWTKNWAGAMSSTVSSKGFADAMASQMGSSLSAMGLMRRQMAEAMEQTLQQMSLPSRKEIVGLAERLTGIEMRLDDLEAKLDQALYLLKK
jgi:polyhydroxyalkanoate synthesis regulator phasin